MDLARLARERRPLAAAEFWPSCAGQPEALLQGILEVLVTVRAKADRIYPRRMQPLLDERGLT